MSQLTCAQSGLEAHFSSVKLMLDDRNRRVAELETQVAQQAEKIDEMEHKLMEGENIRRKLHNQVQELKVRYMNYFVTD